MEDCLHMVCLNLDYSRVVVEGWLQGACRGGHTLDGLQDGAAEAEHGRPDCAAWARAAASQAEQNGEAHPS